MKQELVCVGGPADGRRVPVTSWQRRVFVAVTLPLDSVYAAVPVVKQDVVSGVVIYRRVVVKPSQGEVEFLVPEKSEENPFRLLLDKYPEPKGRYGQGFRHGYDARDSELMREGQVGTLGEASLPAKDSQARELAKLEAENADLKETLRHISQTYCGVKIEGDITFDMVSAFVEGEIERLDQLKVTAENWARSLEGALNDCCDFIEQRKTFSGSVTKWKQCVLTKVKHILKSGKPPN